MPQKNSSNRISEDWWDILMINQHASVRDIHQAYETLRMSHLPINRDRLIPLSQDATDQLQKLDRAFRIALDSKNSITTPLKKTKSSKTTKSPSQAPSNEKDPFRAIVQEWAKTSVQCQPTQSTTPTVETATDDPKTSKSSAKGYVVLFSIIVCGLVGYLFFKNSPPVSSTSSNTTSSAPVLPRTSSGAHIPPQAQAALSALVNSIPVVDPLVLSLQQELNKRGFNAGEVDGLIGPQTRDAIMSAQRFLNRQVDGIPTDALLKALRRANLP